MYPLYLLLMVVFFTYSIIRPNKALPIAQLMSFIIFLFAAFRVGGFDFPEYLEMVEGIHDNPSNLLLILYFSKDIAFAVISYLVTHIASDARPVFVIFALLAHVSRHYICKGIGESAPVFMLMYALLLAPGLDFAAIRIGVAIPLFIIALMTPKKVNRYVFAFFAILFHTSMIIGLPFLFIHRKMSIENKVYISLLFFLIIVISFRMFSFIDPRINQYSQAGGTIKGSIPILMIVTSLLVTGKSLKYNRIHFYNNIYWAAFAIAVMALALLKTSAITAFRLLDISIYMIFVLFAVALCFRKQKIHISLLFPLSAALIVSIYTNFGINTFRAMALDIKYFTKLEKPFD